MVCRYCRPDIFPDCPEPLREGHIAARWGPSDLTREDHAHLHVYVNGEEIEYWNEVCPGRCGFVVIFETMEVFDPYNPDPPHTKSAYRKCTCGIGAPFYATTAERLIVGDVVVVARGRPPIKKREIADVRA